MKKFIPILAFILLHVGSFAQETTAEQNTLRQDALNVYMETSDFIRESIPYVNYVRDIKDAGVYIITTYQATGAGGTEYTYYLTGQNKFEGMVDTVSFVRTSDDTTDSYRAKVIKTLKMGLMRYVAMTPLAEYISINFTQPITQEVSVDKWDNWVFRSSLSTSLSGEQSRNSTSVYSTFSANRVTEKLKIETYANYNYSQSKTVYNTDFLDTTYVYDSKSKGAELRIVKSINDHWSYGGSVGINSSTYSNYDASISVMPGIEYDLYPYSESTRRQLRILYQIGYNYANYTDTTTFFKLEEDLYLQSLTAAYQVIQKWGSINTSFRYRNYLHDWSLNNMYFYTSLSFRIARGLNLNLYGTYSIVHDQLNLPKGNSSYEDVLTRRRQQQTNYSYSMSFGFSYTFGSIYNNVVNPRFGN